MRIAGSVALVTGAASGLGAATARRLGRRGARVALLDMDPSITEHDARDYESLTLACDVTAADQVQAAIETLTDRLGPPRIVVNCAGIAPAVPVVKRGTPTPLSDFERVVAVNLVGTYNVLRLCSAIMTSLPEQDDGERGVIVNTTSVAAFEGQIGQVAYAAAKGGVASLTLPAARELGKHGIRVLAIAPGLFGTPMIAAMPQRVQDAVLSSIPFPRRAGDPEEFARMAEFLIENRLMNGSVHRIDGGLRMQAS